jgi:molecular chaperone DnaK
LGRFILDGIPPAPRGVPQVEVTFDIDANGILSVKAKDKATNKENSIRIEASSGLSKEDIEKMQKDAEMHAADDEKKKLEIEAKNIADQVLYTAEKSLKDNGDKISADLKASVEAKIADLKTSKEGNDIETMKKATEALSTEMSKIGEELAKQNQNTSSPQEEAPKQDGDVKEAEFKEEA